MCSMQVVNAPNAMNTVKIFMVVNCWYLISDVFSLYILLVVDSLVCCLRFIVCSFYESRLAFSFASCSCLIKANSVSRGDGHAFALGDYIHSWCSRVVG